jgi:hypothetical protein
MNQCPYCGDEYYLDVLEYWPDERAWQFDACCEGAYEDAVADLNDGVDRREFADWFERCTGLRPRGYAGGPHESDHYDGRLVLDFGLHLGPVTQAQARDFISTHHRHCRAPAGWRWGVGIFNRHELVGVAWVGRPVARAFDPTEVVEVNRVCVDPRFGRLAWNACSMLYGAAAREAKRRGYQRVITYTLESEAAVTLRAAGWEIDGTTRARARGWDTPSRQRDSARTPNEPKTRWIKEFNR